MDPNNFNNQQYDYYNQSNQNLQPEEATTEKKKLPGWAIALIIVGGVFVLTVVGVFLVATIIIVLTMAGVMGLTGLFAHEVSNQYTTAYEVTTAAVLPEEETEATTEEYYSFDFDDTEATTEEVTEDNSVTGQLPIDGAQTLWFSSGVGGWGTYIALNADGTFMGQYSDSEMGAIGDENPNGECYISQFTGNFTDIKQISEYEYEMYLETLDYDMGEPYIMEGVKFIPCEPYGIEGGERFILYVPGTPISMLPAEALDWWMGKFMDNPPDTLTGPCVYNEKDGYAFYGE